MTIFEFAYSFRVIVVVAEPRGPVVVSLCALLLSKYVIQNGFSLLHERLCGRIITQWSVAQTLMVTYKCFTFLI